jgi:hypothetical protein
VLATSAAGFYGPYRNDNYTVLSNDGTYAKVRVVAEFRPTSASDWQERESTVVVAKIAGVWRISSVMLFSTHDEVAQQQAAAAQEQKEASEAAAKVAAEATAKAKAAADAQQLTRTIETQADYYTKKAAAAKISILPVAEFGYENSGARDHGVYFNVQIRNDDTKDHQVWLQFRFTLDVIDWRNGPQGKSIPRSITFRPETEALNRDIYLVSAGQTTTKKVVFYLGADFGHNVRNFRTDILTIDGLPSVDPRDVLSKFSVTTTLAKPPLVTSPSVGNSWWQCVIAITNTDSLPHLIFGSIEYDYSYRKLGEVQSKSSTGTFFNHGAATIPAQTTVYSVDVYAEDATTPGKARPTTYLVSGLPEQVVSVVLTKLTLKLADANTRSALPVVLARSFTPSGCNYHQ